MVEAARRRDNAAEAEEGSDPSEDNENIDLPPSYHKACAMEQPPPSYEEACAMLSYYNHYDQ